MEYIYKITNKVNNKTYIGRTKDYNRRVKDHKNIAFNHSIKNQKYNRPLYVDIREYGLDSFTFEVLETTTKPKERELYYIDKFNSMDKQFGYNLINGDIGDNNVVPNRVYDIEKVDKAIHLLQTTDIGMSDISKETGLSIQYIRDINQGRRSKRSDIAYPIREVVTKKDLEQVAKAIIHDLQTTPLSQREIAKKHSVSRACVTMINIGKNHKQCGLIYPIR